MLEPARSLLDYLELPVLVGDPDGLTVYVNPHFETCFSVSLSDVRGQPLAMLRA